MKQAEKKIRLASPNEAKYRTVPGEAWRSLDQLALDIEFLLISVVQGVALAALAVNAAEPIGNLHVFYWLYIVSAFLLILNFWSQAIIHAISFIAWPLHLGHNFLYFLASFIEVMAFSHLEDPLKWFGFMSVFFIMAAVLYAVDLRMIKKHEKLQRQKRELYKHIYSRHQFEFTKLVPASILYHVGAFSLIFFYPNVFLAKQYHLILIGLQVIISAVALFDMAKSFQKRSLFLGK